MLLSSLQPIVLTGGRSTRFGRDKLREPLAWDALSKGPWLVDRPIAALREVFGSCIAAVGECDPVIAARFDRVIPDRWAGKGPLGGITSALEALATDQPGVFVTSGDLPNITAAAVRQVLAVADAHPDPWAVIARGTQLEPCFGVYRLSALPSLLDRLNRNDRLSLHDAVPARHIMVAPLDATLLLNANTPADLTRAVQPPAPSS